MQVICAYNKWIDVEESDGMRKTISIGSGIGVGSIVKMVLFATTWFFGYLFHSYLENSGAF